MRLIWPILIQDKELASPTDLPVNVRVCVCVWVAQALQIMLKILLALCWPRRQLRKTVREEKRRVLWRAVRQVKFKPQLPSC